MRHFPLYILSVLLIFSPIQGVFSSGHKKEAIPQREEKTYKAPSQIKRKVNVLSNLEENLVLPILEYINSQTGLDCRLKAYPDVFSTYEGEFDLFLGICFQTENVKIYNYSSDALNNIEPSLYREGILVWSNWHSCIAFNTLFSEELTLELEQLTGKITSVNPEKDLLLFTVLYTLYKKYGKPILVDINDSIPLYRDSKEELIFTIESGQYPAVFGIDGYFKESIEKEYPIEFFYSSFSEAKYPVTTVLGENIAFIPETTENRKGAEYIIDFLTYSDFQSFLKTTCFTPALLPPEASPHYRPDRVIPLECDFGDVVDFKQTWREIVFPELIQELVDEM